MFEKFSSNNARICRHFPFFSVFLLHFTILIGLLVNFILYNEAFPADNSRSNQVWCGTWSTAPQLVEPRNMPPDPGLSNNTLRQIVAVSIGGYRLRMRFSNEFGTSPVTINECHIAVSAGGSLIVPETDQALTFSGKSGITLKPGTTAASDPFHGEIEPRARLAITIFFGEVSSDLTGHPGSRTTSYLLEGNQISSIEFDGAKETAHWYIINSLDIMAEESSGSVVVIGNSITDGRGSGTDQQNRWPDEMAIRLLMNPATRNVGVLNMGIGGNSVLKGGLGPTALDRFDRDVLNQTRIHWLIILEGINDIGGAKSKENAEQAAFGLIDAYQQMIDTAHKAGILVYGGTILPFGDSFYDAPYKQTARDTVNAWIRNSGCFDAVIDFDKFMRDPLAPLQLMKAADTGDHLHPNEIGHQIMGRAVDLSLFE